MDGERILEWLTSQDVFETKDEIEEVNRKLSEKLLDENKFPSIYRDNLFDEDTILEWLTSNRYKQLELGVFMYAIVSLAITFMCYTAFLLFGLKPKEPEKKKEE